MTNTKLRAAASRKPGEHNALDIRPPIAIGVFEIKNVRRAGDKQAAFPGHDAIWERQTVGKHRSFIKVAIAVSIFQQRDDTGGRFARTWSSGIAAILDHK